MSEIFTSTDNLPRIFTHEKWAKQTEVVNLSGFTEWELEAMDLRRQLMTIPAEKITILPDISPTELGIIPTGTIATFDIDKVPNWREFVKGADIGCGMLMAELPVDSEDFVKTQSELDAVMSRLRDEDLSRTFRGNHFVNFARDIATGNVSILIHTGSRRNLQESLTLLVSRSNLYDAKYIETVKSGIDTRRQILGIIEKYYGKGKSAFDTVHNSIQIDDKAHRATVFKGVVAVPKAGSRAVLPSSMSGLIVQYQTDTGAEYVGGTSHGTGRKYSRSEMKGIHNATKLTAHNLGGIMIPSGTTWPPSETDEAYWPIDRSIDLLEKYGIMDPKEQRIFQPIAGIKGD